MKPKKIPNITINDLDKKGDILQQIEEIYNTCFYVRYNKTTCVFAIKEEFPKEGKRFVIKKIILSEEDKYNIIYQECLYEKTFSKLINTVCTEYSATFAYFGKLANCKIKFVDYQDKVHTLFESYRENYNHYFNDNDDYYAAYVTIDHNASQLEYELKKNAMKELKNKLPKLTKKNPSTTAEEEPKNLYSLVDDLCAEDDKKEELYDLARSLES